MPFNNEEAYDMLMLLGECRQNFRAAERLYAERFPYRPQQSRHVFSRLACRVKRFGVVRPHHNIRHRIKRTVQDNRTAEVIAGVELYPHLSVRDMAREFDITKSSVQRILKENKFYAYHVNLCQELRDQDFNNRLQFCNWLLGQTQFFHRNILWTDEATFKSNGQLNLHNAHYWSEVNPHWMVEMNNQNLWSLNVWCGILGDTIIGPFYFDGTLNGRRYAEFLAGTLQHDLLGDIPLAIRRRLWLQQDGCPAHYAAVSRAICDQKFPGRWIGRGGCVAWPARSPDLTPLDFYLWGRLKNLVYKHRPTTKEEMKNRIQEACQNLSAREILNAVDSVRLRLEKCVAQNGRQFEHL